MATHSDNNQVTPLTTDEPKDAGPSQQQIWRQSTSQLESTWQTNCEDGLSTTEAKKRFAEHGPNELEAKKVSNLLRFIKQFNNSIIYILLAAAIITFVLHRYSDSIVIGLVIIANALIGYFQEISADNALAKIKDLLVSESFVIRDGQKITLPSRELVPGDIVRLEAGDSVPADLRLVEADNLNIQESVLTGETDSVEKIEEAIDADDVPLANDRTKPFSTAVTSGSGLGIVIATGRHTEIGKIQQDVAEVKAKPTPLMQNLNRLGVGLSIAIVVAAILLFILGAAIHVYSLPTLLIAVITMALVQWVYQLVPQ